jgi:hypothetical protein
MASYNVFSCKRCQGKIGLLRKNREALRRGIGQHVRERQFGGGKRKATVRR